MKKEKGITLIALVVTIVVLIILATISIYAVLGENGLIAKTQQAKNTHDQAKQDEQNRLDNYAEYVGNYLSGNVGSGGSGGDDTLELPDITPTTAAGTQVKKPNTWDSTKVKAISDGSGNAIPLPDGFYYVGGNRAEGLVISDNSNDANKGTSYATAATLQGNQFVWIPATEADLTRTNFDTTTGNPTTGLNANYTEPSARGYSDGSGTQEASEYNTMRTQVIKYGGFYIGRYEAGDGTVEVGTLRDKVTEDHAVVCKRGVAPYNYVPWGQSMRDIDTAFAPSSNNADNKSTHGAVYLAKSMYQSPESSVVSTLCYGSQWDAMCRYLGSDSKETTPTKDTPELTGSVSTDCYKNIYDLAGNCWEWTMEASSTFFRVLRGGSYLNNSPVSYRYNFNPDYINADGSFRLALYVK